VKRRTFRVEKVHPLSFWPRRASRLPCSRRDQFCLLEQAPLSICRSSLNGWPNVGRSVTRIRQVHKSFSLDLRADPLRLELIRERREFRLMKANFSHCRWLGSLYLRVQSQKPGAGADSVNRPRVPRQTIQTLFQECALNENSRYFHFSTWLRSRAPCLLY
jgi:hypothetical protein